MFATGEPAEEAAAIAAAPPAEAPAAAAADPLGSDLLNMFQTTQIETETWRPAGSAGDVNSRSARTWHVAVALGCKLPDDEEMAA
jgi:hypothetical protein